LRGAILKEKAGQLYGMGSIGGFCHLYIGQEAVVVGMQSVCEPGDSVITSYRDHGHILACGMDPKGVMAELTGREGGYSKGKGRTTLWNGIYRWVLSFIYWPRSCSCRYAIGL
jgi:TPP-dependent pyruvate/acetoin dehydrogenase alpha subunit